LTPKGVEALKKVSMNLDCCRYSQELWLLAGRTTARSPAKTTPAAAEGRSRSDQKAPVVSISDPSLKAVQAHSEGATPVELLNYLLREFGMTVRPNHLGAALQRHRRAGQLENRDQRWYLSS
jgi:hypothetical protein